MWTVGVNRPAWEKVAIFLFAPTSGGDFHAGRPEKAFMVRIIIYTYAVLEYAPFYLSRFSIVFILLSI